VVTASDCPRPRNVQRHGLFKDTDCSRTRTVQGHGLCADWPRLRTRERHLPGQFAISPRLFRGHENLPAGRGYACLVKNCKFQPYECQSATDRVRADLPASPTQLDRTNGHFPVRCRTRIKGEQEFHPAVKSARVLTSKLNLPSAPEIL
jgi:hypothetical protein